MGACCSRRSDVDYAPFRPCVGPPLPPDRQRSGTFPSFPPSCFGSFDDDHDGTYSEPYAEVGCYDEFSPLRRSRSPTSDL